jgi:hypothetical protein
LSGLSAAQINSTTSSPVSFEMRRDAGIIRFEGMFRNGDGAGPFDFAPNRAYLDTLRSYKNVPVDKLISMRTHGIDANFARKANQK